MIEHTSHLIRQANARQADLMRQKQHLIPTPADARKTGASSSSSFSSSSSSSSAASASAAEISSRERDPAVLSGVDVDREAALLLLQQQLPARPPSALVARGPFALRPPLHEARALTAEQCAANVSALQRVLAAKAAAAQLQQRVVSSKSAPLSAAASGDGSAAAAADAAAPSGSAFSADVAPLIGLALQERLTHMLHQVCVFHFCFLLSSMCMFQLH